jgi:uncharacterized protein involved in response to NO
MLSQVDSLPPAGGDLPLFRAGFRPFFLLSGVQAALSVPAWLAQALNGLDLRLDYAPVLWHGHEMAFGFAAAAVAGFLLTAVPNWTGAKPLSGKPLAALTALWVAARLAFAVGGALPPWVAAALALPFLPVLAAVLARPLLAAGKLRNIAFLPILAVLTAAQGLVLAEMVGIGGWGRQGLYLGLFVLLLLITVVGGRIIPGFTVNGLRQRNTVVQPRSSPWLDGASIGSLVVAAVVWLMMPDSPAAGALAILSGLLNAARLTGWCGLRTAGVPLLWVLHLAYAWLPVGLVLLGLSCFVASFTPQMASHALTAGCIGLMTLGVMSRAALGHSGRPLLAAPLTAAAYVLVSLAAVVRVFGVMIDPSAGLMLSGLLWSGGFALYVAVYAPICLTPRADGRPG